MMISASIASTGILPGIAYLAGVEDSKVLTGAALVGTFSGYALANYISNTQNYSRGDAMCFSNIWALSAAVPVSLLVATKSEEPKLYVGGAILGAGLGMWLGDELVKGKEFSTSQGVYMWLGSFGGAFVLGGTALLAISDNNDTWQYIPTIMSIGAIGGFALTYSAFYDNPKIQEKKLSSDLRLDFNPMALTSAFSGAATNNPLQYYYSPLVKLTYKF
jgi:hypothetical protein